MRATEAIDSASIYHSVKSLKEENVNVSLRSDKNVPILVHRFCDLTYPWLSPMLQYVVYMNSTLASIDLYLDDIFRVSLVLL